MFSFSVLSFPLSAATCLKERRYQSLLVPAITGCVLVVVWDLSLSGGGRDRDRDLEMPQDVGDVGMKRKPHQKKK